MKWWRTFKIRYGLVVFAGFDILKNIWRDRKAAKHDTIRGNLKDIFNQDKDEDIKKPDDTDKPSEHP